MSEGVLVIGCGVEGSASAEEFGFKAWNLWRMARTGMHVPPAFVLGTRFCRDYFQEGRKAPPGLGALLATHLHEVERATGLSFGGARRPLLVSVRSGAKVSMPGMLDTVLDIGLCDATVPGLLRLTGNPRLVWDSYRRLVQSFAETVHGASPAAFDAALAARVREDGVESASDLDFDALRAVARDFLDIHESETGVKFPQQAAQQLEAAVVAVWGSWAADKAVRYRRMLGIPDDAGTAVTIQRMVYGNAGGTSGAGVAFTRDPATGANVLYLDFLFNAQGEDVVSGRHGSPDGERLATVLPAVHDEIRTVARRLEAEFGDMQEFEFTVQDARLFILQTRTGKRTPWANLQIAVDQVGEGLIKPAEALERLAGCDLDKLQRLRIVCPEGGKAACRGMAAGVGVATGQLVLDARRAMDVRRAGGSPILVCNAISTGDIGGIEAAAGVLTATGSRTSHAAVVARQLDKPCVVGCAALAIDAGRRRCVVAGHWLVEGDTISIDGATGEVFVGPVQVQSERPTAALAQVTQWRELAHPALHES